MKKIFALLMVMAMLLALAACGNTTSGDAAANPDTPASAELAENAEPAESAEPADASDVSEPVVPVMSHAEYVAAALDTAVTVDTYVQATQSWWDDKITIYAQSEDGAYFIYNAACAEAEAAKLTPGTKIRVYGYKSEWSGEVEIIDASFQILDGSFVAQPVDVTALLGSEALIEHQNELVSFKGMTVEPIADENGNESAFLYKWNGSGADGDDLYFNVSAGGNTYNFTVESYLCGAGTEVYEAVKQLKVGDVIDLTGFLYWYEGVNPHITSVSPAA